LSACVLMPLKPTLATPALAILAAPNVRAANAAAAIRR
jgi:hypothetical protein